MIKTVKIKCISESNYNKLQIFDNDNKKIVDTVISNEYLFESNVNKFYKVKILSNNRKIESNIFICDSYTKPYIFDLRKIIQIHPIFIKLIDHNYVDLKIEKGEIFFWLNHIL